MRQTVGVVLQRQLKLGDAVLPLLGRPLWIMQVCIVVTAVQQLCVIELQKRSPKQEDGSIAAAAASLGARIHCLRWPECFRRTRCCAVVTWFRFCLSRVKFWQTETVLAENSLGWYMSSKFRSGDSMRNALDRSAWRLLVETATSTWHAPESERERVWLVHFTTKLLGIFIPNKKLSYCWETVRHESMPRIAEMDVKMTT